MTTVVTISAHCSDTKEVRVVVTGAQPEEFTLADGEKVERFAYDDRVITVQEVAKIDRRALEVDAAEFAVAQARLRLHDAASRGFHMNNRALLEADMLAAQHALDALLEPAPTASAGIDPAVAAATETKTYSDGATATGPGPLPDQSPAQQEAEIIGQGDAALTPEAVKFLDSLDPAPFADLTNPGTSEH